MNHGGKRSGAGRKPVRDRVIQIPVGVRASALALHGKEKILLELKRVIAKFVSIHAPHTRCDLLLQAYKVNRQFQSTHPIRGATCFVVARHCVLLFQSTHPIRGATLTLMFQYVEKHSFNPRTPYEVRLTVKVICFGST